MFFFGFSPMYWLVIGIGILLSLWAQMKVKGAFARYARVPTRSGMTGADVARAILREEGIDDVRVEPISGTLSDHYDPRSKTLRLSEPVYGSSSLAAFGVAAHEVGHAIQHARSYWGIQFRSAWVPLANLGGGLSMVVIILAFLLGGAQTALGESLAWAGVGLFSLTTIFTLVTLPVEFDASSRALAILEGRGYLGSDEMDGARAVLNAAALTYVAAFITSLLQLLYWAYALGLFGRRSD